MPKLTLFLLLPGCFFTHTSDAAVFIAPTDRANIEQQQRAMLEQAGQQRDALQRSRELSESATLRPAPHADHCWHIHRIELQGSTLLSSTEQQALTHPWQNRCMTLIDIQHLVRAISQYYLAQGYVTSQAGLPEQDITDGHLRITVTEGRIESLTQAGESPRSLSMAFPSRADKVLNLRDLEQGLEQLNRLPSQPVTIDIQPGSQPGYSRVVVVPGVTQFPARLSLTADNSGQKSTGSGQINAALTLDNPLRMADQWSLSAARDSAFRHHRYSRSLSGYVTQPYGHWLLSYHIGWSDYAQPLPFPGSRWRYSGMAQSHRLGSQRTLWRDSRQKVAWEMALSRRRTENRIAGQLLNNSSGVINSLTLAIPYSRTLGNGYATLMPTFSQGLRGMGAVNDDPAAPDAPRGQFRKLSLNASYLYPLSPSLYYLTTFYGQTSPDNLYASERIVVGGHYSVRGFKEQSLSGNQGAYWRNELNWQSAVFLSMSTLTLTAALDSGWVNSQRERAQGGNVVGAGFGLTLSARRFSHTIMVAKPLRYPKALQPDRIVAYWQATLSL